MLVPFLVEQKPLALLFLELSLVHISLDEWGVYFGVPVKKVNIRSKKVLALAKDFKKNNLQYS